jgi:hypothetical protein
LAVKVSTLVVLVLKELKAGVTPAGSPEADKLTVPLKPFRPTTVMVLLALPPAERPSAPVEDERLKLDPVMVTTMVVLAVVDPLVPVTVTV